MKLNVVFYFWNTQTVNCCKWRKILSFLKPIPQTVNQKSYRGITSVQTRDGDFLTTALGLPKYQHQHRQQHHHHSGHGVGHGEFLKDFQSVCFNHISLSSLWSRHCRTSSTELSRRNRFSSWVSSQYMVYSLIIYPELQLWFWIWLFQTVRSLPLLSIVFKVLEDC